jgi:uncharacterized protein (DUF4415 family)
MSENSMVRRTRRLPKKGKTDWERVRNLTDREIEEAVASDPDAAPLLTKEWLEKATLVLPMAKKGVFIRFDRDVVDWFKQQGPRYQTRMNAVLRSYMEAHGTRGRKTVRSKAKTR